MHFPPCNTRASQECIKWGLHLRRLSFRFGLFFSEQFSFKPAEDTIFEQSSGILLVHWRTLVVRDQDLSGRPHGVTEAAWPRTSRTSTNRGTNHIKAVKAANILEGAAKQRWGNFLGHGQEPLPDHERMAAFPLMVSALECQPPCSIPWDEGKVSNMEEARSRYIMLQRVFCYTPLHTIHKYIYIHTWQDAFVLITLLWTHLNILEVRRRGSNHTNTCPSLNCGSIVPDRMFHRSRFVRFPGFIYSMCIFVHQFTITRPCTWQQP